MKKTGLLLSLLTLLWYCGAAQTPVQTDLAQFPSGRRPDRGRGVRTRTWNCAGRRYPARKLRGIPAARRAKSRCAERPRTSITSTSSPGLGRNAVYTYRVAALGADGKQLSETPQISAAISDFSDEQLQQMVQRYTFRYFWDFADPLTGLAYERSNDKRADCITTGGSGFGVMGIVAGVHNGFVTRPEAVARLTKIVGALEKLPRFHGAWAHWYNTRTGQPYHFSEKDNGGDLVETAFLVQGLLAAQGYFDGNDAAEKALRDRIEQLWREVEWSHYTQGQNALYWALVAGLRLRNEAIRSKGTTKRSSPTSLQPHRRPFRSTRRSTTTAGSTARRASSSARPISTASCCRSANGRRWAGRCSGCTTRTRDSTRAGWPTGLQTTGNRTAAIRWSTAPTASTTRTVGWDTAPISGA